MLTQKCIRYSIVNPLFRWYEISLEPQNNYQLREAEIDPFLNQSHLFRIYRTWRAVGLIFNKSFVLSENGTSDLEDAGFGRCVQYKTHYPCMKAIVSFWISELGNFWSIFTKFRYKMPSQNHPSYKNTQGKKDETFHYRTGHAEPEGKYRYSSILSSITVLHVSWAVNAMPQSPRKENRYLLYRSVVGAQGRSGTYCIGVWVGPRVGLVPIV
jgi:hypothetical protein